MQRAGASSFLELQGAALLASFIGASWYPSLSKWGRRLTIFLEISDI